MKNSVRNIKFLPQANMIPRTDTAKQPPLDPSVYNEHSQDKEKYHNGAHVYIPHGRGLLAPVEGKVFDHLGSLGRIAAGKELVGFRLFRKGAVTAPAFNPGMRSEKDSSMP